jgi:hypothetical protein
MEKNDQGNNIRWVIGTGIFVSMSVLTGVFILIQRVEHISTLEETAISHNSWQDKQLQNLEEHLQNLELLFAKSSKFQK